MRTSISADTLPVIGFNPRIRDGCEGERIGYIAGEPVSIHASVMDANLMVDSTPNIGSFNPRIRDGCEKLLH